MANAITLHYPDATRRNPTVLPRQLVEGFTFIQFDLSRQGSFGHLVDESLSRPISRKRLEKSGLIDRKSGNYHVVQDVNYYSPTWKPALERQSDPDEGEERDTTDDDQESGSEYSDEEQYSEDEEQWEEEERWAKSEYDQESDYEDSIVAPAPGRS